MLDYLAQALYESYDPLVGEKLPWESFDEKNKDYFRRSAKTLALKLFEKMKEPSEELMDNCADVYHTAREAAVAQRKSGINKDDAGYVNANFPADWLSEVLTAHIEGYESMLDTPTEG